MKVIVRPAVQEDAEAMCQVINPLIEEGNSTARSWPLDSTRMFRDVIATPSGLSCCVAVFDQKILGFQSLCFVKPSATQSPAGRWGSIASFVEADAQGLGLGQALFEHTKPQATSVGLDFIDATIRADNISGLRYYAKLGFVDYSHLPNKPLADGRKVDRIQKRFDL
jgi:GNAT superfamily N-acetyltransferase